MVIKKDQPAWICSDASTHHNERNAYGHEAASTLAKLTGTGWARWQPEVIAKAIQVLQDFQRVVLELPAPATPEPVVVPAIPTLTSLQIQQDLRQELSSVRTAFRHWTNLRRLVAVNNRAIHLGNSLNESVSLDLVRIELIQLTAFLILWIEKLDSHP